MNDKQKISFRLLLTEYTQYLASGKISTDETIRWVLKLEDFIDGLVQLERSKILTSFSKIKKN